MSNKETKNTRPDGELSETDLDKVAGGQEVVKLGKITVTAKREEPQQVVKLDKVVVTAKREQPQNVVKLDKVTVTAKREPPLAGTQVASAEGVTKKN